MKTQVRGFCTEMLVQVKTLSNKYKKLLLTPYRWTIGIEFSEMGIKVCGLCVRRYMVFNCGMQRWMKQKLKS